MEYRQLGRSGLRVSRLALGTMTFGGHGQFRDVGTTDVDGARRQIDMALDAGVNLIDTADMYSADLSLLEPYLTPPASRALMGTAS